MSLWARILNGLRSILGLFLPVFSKPDDFRRLNPVLRWTIHVILIALTLTFLWFLNYWLQLELIVKAPPVLRRFWLPLLFVLLYILSWLGLWLWNLLGPEAEVSDFPDIDEAWRRGLRILHESGIEITEVPVFLVLGRSLSGERSLFEAAKLNLKVREAPDMPHAPLHFFANSEGVYITCEGSSLLGRQASILAGEWESGLYGPGSSSSWNVKGEAVDEFKTVSGDARGMQFGAKAVAQRAQQTKTAPIKKGTVFEMSEKAQAEGAVKSRFKLYRNQAEVSRLIDRLKHLCRLIVRERRPYCPINGMLLVLPLASTDTDEDAGQTAALVNQELSAAREVLKVSCPMVAIQADMEFAPGFFDLIERFPPQRRHQRLGQRFPLVPDIAPEGVSGMIESGMHWFANILFPNLIYELLRTESASGEDFSTVVHGNLRLCQLMFEIRERQKRLNRILSRGAISALAHPPLLGGCYFAGTGRNADTEQAFTAGVFRRLLEDQNAVAWTEEALIEESGYQRTTRLGYVMIAIIVIGVISLIGYQATQSRS